MVQEADRLTLIYADPSCYCNEMVYIGILYMILYIIIIYQYIEY